MRIRPQAYHASGLIRFLRTRTILSPWDTMKTPVIFCMILRCLWTRQSQSLTTVFYHYFRLTLASPPSQYKSFVLGRGRSEGNTKTIKQWQANVLPKIVVQRPHEPHTSCIMPVTSHSRAPFGLFPGCFKQKSYVHSRGPHGLRAAVRILPPRTGPVEF